MIFIIIISFTLLILWPSQETPLLVLDQRERNYGLDKKISHRYAMTLTLDKNLFQGHCQQKLQVEFLVKYGQDWIRREKIPVCFRNGFQRSLL